MNTVWALLWCILELNLSIIGGSIPTLKPFLQRFCPRLLGSSPKQSSGSRVHAERFCTEVSQLDGTPGGYRRKVSVCAGGSPSAKVQGGSSRMVHGDAGSEEFVMQDSIVKTMQYDVQFDEVTDANELMSPVEAREVEFRFGFYV